ncbi:hypothetical protein AMS68_001926 [Peltaster fructicola]|uniref:Mid2 domain-containing protein n=1 Tax=Peltaster fructicola TaxID=286661 RepID=A0A6H0XP55_9PEZI|nr:hypothetical protein AMS68_001926 [Peltaster fructicola]
MRFSTFLTVTVFFFHSVRASSGVCYGQTGNQDLTLGVCDPSAQTSSCCKYGEYCLSNGLCQRPGVTSTNSTVLTIYGVHGCTDASSTTGECAPYARCIQRGVGITACNTPNTYCCYGLGGCDCSNSTQVFTLPAGKIITTLPASAPTTIASASVSATASASPAAAASSSNNSVAIGAGVGVGVGVALLIAAGVGFWLWRRRRNASTVVKEIDDVPDYSSDTKHASTAYGAPGYSAGEPPEQATELELTYVSEMDATSQPVQLEDASTMKSPHQRGPSELSSTLKSPQGGPSELPSTLKSPQGGPSELPTASNSPHKRQSGELA